MPQTIKLAFACSINLYNEIQTIVFQNITRGDGRETKYNISELEEVQGAYFISSVGMMRKQSKVLGAEEEINIPIIITELTYYPNSFEHSGATVIQDGIEKLALIVEADTKVQTYFNFY